MLSNLLLVVHLLLAVAIVVLVLLQQGKGADMGAAFGGGSSQSLFGARGSGNFLSRLTSIIAVSFFATSLVLAYLYTREGEQRSILEETPVEQSVAEQDSDVPPGDEASEEQADIPEAPQ